MGARVYLSTNRAAPNDPNTLVLDSVTQGALDTYRIAASEWTEVTDLVVAGQVRRGRGDTEMDPAGAGTARLTLTDPDGLFDPLNRQSSLWPGAQTGMKVRITNSSDVPIFTGRIDDTDVTRAGPFAARIELDCVDEMAVFAQTELAPAVRAAENITDRIGWVLSTVAYTGEITADTAYNSAVALDLTTVVLEGNAAAHLNELAASEGFGMIFIDRTGAVRFRRRRTHTSVSVSGLPVADFRDRVPAVQFVGAYDGETASSIMTAALDGGNASTSTFVLTVDGGNASTAPANLIVIDDFTAASLGNTIVNDASVTNRAGTTRTAQNALSINLNGRITYQAEQADAWYVDAAGAEAQRQADWIVDRLGDGGYGVIEVSTSTDQLGEYQRNLLAALDLGDLVHVRITPPYTVSTQTYRQDAFVVGLTHRFSANGYGLSTSARLAAATSTTSYWG